MEKEVESKGKVTVTLEKILWTRRRSIYCILLGNQYNERKPHISIWSFPCKRACSEFMSTNSKHLVSNSVLGTIILVEICETLRLHNSL